MHCWKDSFGMPISSVVTALLISSTHSKWAWTWRKEKNHSEQDQVNRKFVSVQQCSSWTGIAGCSGRCEQVPCRDEAASICPAITLVSSHALSKAKATVSFHGLTGWSSDPVARTHYVRYTLTLKNMISMILTFDFVLFSSARTTSEISAGSSGTWLQRHTQKSMFHYLTWRSNPGSIWWRSIMSAHTYRRIWSFNSFSTIFCIFFACPNL